MADTGAATAPPSGRPRRRAAGLAIAAAVLLVLLLLSLALGSKPLPPSEVIEALWRDNGRAHVIVVEQRIPQTVLAVLIGVALAVAGALMQGLTRNPLADPGLLGVAAGACSWCGWYREPDSWANCGRPYSAPS